MQPKVYVLQVGVRSGDTPNTWKRISSAGVVSLVDGATFWTEGSSHGYRVVELESMDPLPIRELISDDASGVTFLALEGFSGVFWFDPVAGRMCAALGFARRASGLRVAQPVRTNGPWTRCLAVAAGIVCGGDAWGTIAVWSVSNPLADPPEWVISAHDQDGCASVNVLDQNLLMSVGGGSKQVRIWQLLENGESSLVHEVLLDEGMCTHARAMLVEESILLVLGKSDGTLTLAFFGDSKQTNNATQELDLRLFESAIAFIDIVQDELIVVQEDNHEFIVLERIGAASFDAIGRMNPKQRIIGVTNDGMMVFDSLRRRSIAEIIDQIEAEKWDAHQENDLIQMFERTNAVIAMSTRRALDNPKDKVVAFPDELIQVDVSGNPSIAKGRPCCDAGARSSNARSQLWVKRKIRPRHATKARPPLHQPKRGPDQSTAPKLLPPFCLGRKNLPEAFYLEKKDDQLYFAVNVKE
jgi:hypothetical protein